MPAPTSATAATVSRSSLREIAGIFLRLGIFAFGGPAAHIAMMRQEVTRRKWMDDPECMDLVGATNVIPVPNSAELAIRLAPQFGQVVSIDLRQNAKDGSDAMRRIAVFVRSSVFPDTLPRGSGNEGDFNGSSGRHFYPGRAGQILTEQNGPILLEDDT